MYNQNYQLSHENIHHGSINTHQSHNIGIVQPVYTFPNEGFNNNNNVNNNDNQNIPIPVGTNNENNSNNTNNNGSNGTLVPIYHQNQRSPLAL